MSPNSEPRSSSSASGSSTHVDFNRAGVPLLEIVSEPDMRSGRDAAAYAHLSSLWKLPEGDATRVRDYAAAVQEAIDAPLAIVQLAARACELLHALPARTNARLGSDLVIAANLAALAADAAAWNVRVNLPSLADATRAATLGSDTDAKVQAAQRMAAEAVQAITQAAKGA